VFNEDGSDLHNLATDLLKEWKRLVRDVRDAEEPDDADADAGKAKKSKESRKRAGAGGDDEKERSKGSVKEVEVRPVVLPLFFLLTVTRPSLLIIRVSTALLGLSAGFCRVTCRLPFFWFGPLV
jgi:hypothetical protein